MKWLKCLCNCHIIIKRNSISVQVMYVNVGNLSHLNCCSIEIDDAVDTSFELQITLNIPFMIFIVIPYKNNYYLFSKTELWSLLPNLTKYLSLIRALSKVSLQTCPWRHQHNLCTGPAKRNHLCSYTFVIDAEQANLKCLQPPTPSHSLT